ncbi:MAG TPA: tetratricopeptide repeat protein, partial [Pirellulaceae bacterium]|nr:tetratricopeptide repeat protein [Pirellulaceae bacterium]
VIARFEAERQALALMDHANIARVLDAGATPASRPYFVMDLVRGVPITRYCDEHRLTPRQRLELFIPVCQAVQHAHQKGIIHRDLKPSNVLVAQYDGRPVPKVIDFGVAKAAGQPLTEKTLVTGFGAIVGSLEYMSPEQAEINQLDIDTRSDIYSLGVLLYELLTGSPPFSRAAQTPAGMLEMLRLIREQEPTRPSTKLSTAEGLPTLAANRGTEPAKLTRLLRGELDWIVMKALEKDRSRRYETATSLAHDLERYLADEPVLACPPSASYRLWKFARRHKAALGTAAVVAAAILLAVGSLGWAARDRAAGRLKSAGEVNAFLARAELHYADNELPEALAEVEKAKGLLEPGDVRGPLKHRVEQWRKDLETAMRLEEIRLDTLSGNQRKRRYGDVVQAIREYGIDIEALPVEQAAARIKASQIKLDLALTLGSTAEGLQFGERPASTPWRRLLAISQAVDPDSLQMRLYEAVAAKDVQTLRDLASDADPARLRTRTLAQLGNSLSTAGELQSAVDFLRRAQRQHPSDFSINLQLAYALIRTGQPSREVTAFRRAALAARPKSALAHQQLAVALFAEQRPDEAVLICQQALALDPSYAPAYYTLGDALAMQEKLNDAIAAYRAAIVRNPTDAEAHFALGRTLERHGDPAEALDKYRAAFNLDPTVVGLSPALGRLLRNYGRLEEAIDVFRNAVDQQRDTNKTTAQKDILRRGFADVLVSRAWQLATATDLQQRDPARALELALEASTLVPGYTSYWRPLGVAQYRLGDYHAAAQTLGMVRQQAPDFNDSVYLFFLSMAYARLNQAEKARELFNVAAQWRLSDYTADAEVRKLCAEAAEVLGLAVPPDLQEPPVLAKGPTLLAPASSGTLPNGTLGAKQPMVWEFDWSDVPGATRYHLSVKAARADAPSVSQSKLAASSYRYESKSYVPEPNRTGWRWKVRALVDDVWTDWSQEGTFTVEPIDLGAAATPKGR